MRRTSDSRRTLRHHIGGERPSRWSSKISFLKGTDVKLIDRVSSKLFSWTLGRPVSAAAVDLQRSANCSRGCNQTHGTHHNPFVKLAEETATVTYLPEDVHSIFLKDGKHLQGYEARSLWSAVESLLAEGIKYSRTDNADITEDTSLMDWFSQTVKDLNISCQQKARMLEVVQSWGGYTGKAIETQSFKNAWLEMTMPGGMSSSSTYDSGVATDHLQII